MFDVLVLSPEALLFSGKARCVILPGEQGVFEVGPFHRPLISRLLPGYILIDGQPLAIQRGVVKVLRDTLTAIVEPELAQESELPAAAEAPSSSPS